MTEVTYGDLTISFKTASKAETAKWRYMVELARELKYPTDPKNWNMCRRAAWVRAAAAEGGLLNG